MTGRPRGFDWPALMRAGIGGLGLSPEMFWRLSPAELLLMLGPGAAPPMTRAAFEDLAARFPDPTAREETDCDR